MCESLLFGDLKSGVCPSHPTYAYTCKVTITPKIHNDYINLKSHLSIELRLHDIGLNCWSLITCKSTVKNMLWSVIITKIQI